jgi:polyribonucleotide nucleotidyltransferase
LKKEINEKFTWGDMELSLSTGKLAFQANGAVLARYGDTMVLATATASEPNEALDFFPLTVDYEERLYAGGRISSSRFIKREGRPSEKAILTSRLIDRSIRPLFPKDFHHQVQVIVTVLSIDKENDPGILSILAASAALSISDIPWKGPVGALRVGHDNGEFIFNPTDAEQELSDLDLIISGTESGFHMVEAGAKEVAEDDMIKAFHFADKHIKDAITGINKLVLEVGKEKFTYQADKLEEKLNNEIINYIKENAKEELFSTEHSIRELAGKQLKAELYQAFEERATTSQLSDLFEKTMRQIVRADILEKGQRPDGRTVTEIRPISIEIGLLPRTHGSAIFQRGNTQVLSVVTLGSTSLEQLVEGMGGEYRKRYIHHYNAAPYSTGEVGRVGSPGRREIGHGALAERALIPVLPGDDKFPYTIRVVSEVLAQSGSTSMGSTCGSTLALMDAGVPISSPVSGVAMGLVHEGNKWVVLTDIQAIEDFYGDMDFKVAGTEKGITAMQMDIKTTHISQEMVEKIIPQAREGRIFIMNKMLDALPEYRSKLSEYAPRNVVVKINPDKIGIIIGPGGKMINSIIEDYGVLVDVSDDGTVNISGTDQDQVEQAVRKVEALTHEVKVGEVFDGVVKRILPFGAFVEILPGKEGMVHISKLAEYRVEDINKEVKVGDRFKVKVSEIDPQGRVNLTKRGIQSSKNEE